MTSLLGKAALIAILAVGMAAGQQIKPCCYPEQYEAGISIITGQVQDGEPVALNLFQYGGYDLKNGQQGFDMFITEPDGTNYNFKIIQNYGEKTQWVIFEDFRFCERQELLLPAPLKCIPDGAVGTYTNRIGGRDGLSIDTYSFVFPNGPGAYRGSSTFSVVSGGSCVPVGQTFMGEEVMGGKTTPQVSSVGVTDFKRGIENPAKWFTVPDFCQSAVNGTSRMPNHIREFMDTHGNGQFF